ncbi:LacI family DNA-binding transcriptional regulator [Novosphingobium sp. SG720]|uniref:LacI family DNA-binding transcriptional regulator n=1 Tax=Novosphingobium sp. SG720 TaxID=2586998 RepID=UPI00180206C8|nr:LacI family DNA-binding transcriptional regulator [Novosphingobium sp. SG720]NKJ45117.1 LacI family transcriptional regulator [Novosphingobium sp. SG720]
MTKRSDTQTDTSAGVPGRRNAVTVHDVARVAGVSSMTVSRVVNGTKVREELRAKVEAAIQELNYVPNLAARAARSGAFRIGVLFSNPQSSNLGSFLMGAFGQSGRDGSQLDIEPIAGHDDPIDAVRVLLGRGVDGMILPPPLCDSLEALDLLWQAKVAAVSFATADPRSHSSAVLIDDFEGARALTNHLIELGHRDIAFIRGNPRHSPAMRREEGFRAAMAQAGLPIRPGWLREGDFTYRSGLDAGQALLECPPEERPTAIFASNDDMAAAVTAMALGQGIRVPAELSVAGFDDTPIASLLWPQLTTVHQPIADMAAMAVEIVADTLRQRRNAGSDDSAVRHHVAPFELKVRGSSGPAPR